MNSIIEDTHLLSDVRPSQDRDDATGCLPVSLRTHQLGVTAAPEIDRLLRVLLLWVGALPAKSKEPVMMVPCAASPQGAAGDKCRAVSIAASQACLLTLLDRPKCPSGGTNVTRAHTDRHHAHKLSLYRLTRSKRSNGALVLLRRENDERWPWLDGHRLRRSRRVVRLAVTSGASSASCWSTPADNAECDPEGALAL